MAVPRPELRRQSVCGNCMHWNTLDMPGEIDLREGRPGQCRERPPQVFMVDRAPSGQPIVGQAWPGVTSQHPACGRIIPVNYV